MNKRSILLVVLICIFSISFSQTIISTFPYTEGFESGTGGWTSSGTLSSWARGIPNGAIISSAASGQYAWITNLTGDYNNSELSYLESPTLNFSALAADPILYFSHTFITEQCCDEGWIETSTNGGLTWTKLLDNGGAIEWYNEIFNLWWDGTSSSGAGNWVNAENVLLGLAGVPNAKIRFVFSSDASITEEGFGVDNIRIQLPPAEDAKMVGVLSPISSCGLGSAEQVCIRVMNNGSDTLLSIPIAYSLNNATAVVDTINSSLLPGDYLTY